MKKKINMLIFVLLICFVSLNPVLAQENNLATNIVRCGGLGEFGIPAGIPAFTRGLYTTLKYLVPVLIILFGILDFVKAVMASKEQDMKEYQNKFIRRLISGVAIFLVLAVVNFVFSQTKVQDANGILKCLSCLSTTESACDVYQLNDDNIYQRTEDSKCAGLDIQYCSTKSNCSWNGSKCVYDENKVSCSILDVQSCSNRYECKWTGSSCVYDSTKTPCEYLGQQSCSNRSDCVWSGPSNGSCSKK